eukprot:TRINITY_DN11814_c0_g1_i1.p1 TRINITY_DN11814_c0_g1~~TRINITY_DN11814_c0_g1_i1.p1  ORF type:complete len:279 (-),score=32.59 TRINITY_DN11814_c0_g1_i1:233-1069(-)
MSNLEQQFNSKLEKNEGLKKQILNLEHKLEKSKRNYRELERNSNKFELDMTEAIAVKLEDVEVKEEVEVKENEIQQLNRRIIKLERRCNQNLVQRNGVLFFAWIMSLIVAICFGCVITVSGGVDWIISKCPEFMNLYSIVLDIVFVICIIVVYVIKKKNDFSKAQKNVFSLFQCIVCAFSIILFIQANEYGWNVFFIGSLSVFVLACICLILAGIEFPSKEDNTAFWVSFVVLFIDTFVIICYLIWYSNEFLVYCLIAVFLLPPFVCLILIISESDQC